jgi:hypothetical protein
VFSIISAKYLPKQVWLFAKNSKLYYNGPYYVAAK